MDLGWGGMAGSVPEIEAIRDRDTLQAYLSADLVVESQMLALRCALRVMPLISMPLDVKVGTKQPLLIGAFQALLFSWAALKYPANEHDFIDAADTSLTPYVRAYANDSAVATVVSAVYADDAVDACDAAVGSVHALDRAADIAAEKGVAATRSAIWAAIRADLHCMRNASYEACLAMPLWPAGINPSFITFFEEVFLVGLELFGYDWKLVYDFYVSLRDGRPLFASLGSAAEEVLLTLAHEERNFWGRHPDDVMRDLVERLRPPEASASQRIVSFLYQAKGEVSISDIRGAFFERFAYKFSDHTIRGRLSDLAASGAIVRVRPGVYIHPDWVDKSVWDFFISYSSKDLATAEAVVEILEQAGYSVLAQFKDFSTGSNFVTEMQKGLERAGRVIALLSPAYVASKHCQAEWSAAYNRDPSGEQRYLVPLLIEETSLPPLARQIVYRSIVGLAGDARRVAVLEAVGKLLRPEVPCIRSPYDFELTDRQTVEATGGAMNTISVLPNRDPNDARRRLEAARETAADLIADLRNSLFQVAPHYVTELERYQNRLPLDAGESIYSADAALRNIRDDLERDIQHGIDDRFLSRARRLIEAHYGLRIYFPELLEFYEDVRQSRQTEPVPLEALGKLRKAIEEHTPDVFEPSVGEAFAHAVDVAPAARAESNDALVEAGHPPVTSTLPPDPIANVDPVRAAQHAEMSMQNRIWALLRGVEKGGKALERIEKVSSTYQKWIDPILDWLSKSN